MSLRDAPIQALDLDDASIGDNAARLADRLWREVKAHGVDADLTPEQLFKAGVRRGFGHGQLVVINQALGRRTCRVCGCRDEVACPGGCAWAAEDLCTQCVGPS